MSYKYNKKFFIFLSLIISIISLKVKVDGSQKEYCFTKPIEQQDTMKIFFLISSGKTEQVDVIFKDQSGRILYQESVKQGGTIKVMSFLQGIILYASPLIVQIHIISVLICKLQVNQLQ